MTDFVGRRNEIELLGRALDSVRQQVGTSKPGKCLIVRGRRRVGKSRLVEAFLDQQPVPSVFFTASRQRGRELSLFAAEAAGSDLPGAELFNEVELSSWDAALRLLAQALPDDAPSVVVVDELPYLVEGDPGFEATLQKQWDRHLSHKPVLLLLVGSDLSVMEALNTYGRAFFQRGTDLVVHPLTPLDVATLVGAPDAADAFDAWLLTGGLPLNCEEWPNGLGMWDYLEDALATSTSALIVSAERVLSAELPTEALARDVLAQIGAGDATFSNIARAAGGLTAPTLQGALALLTAKRIVARELPLSTKPAREARYRVNDGYLRFWLTFVGPHLSEIERGRPDRVLARIRAGWTSWRGRAVEPIVRESLRRLLPVQGLDAAAVGAYWTRNNDPEIDVVGADHEPVANAVTFAGSVKWREPVPFGDADLRKLAADVQRLPGGSVRTPLVGVSRNGFTASGLTLSLGPDELLEAWAGQQSNQPEPSSPDRP